MVSFKEQVFHHPCLALSQCQRLDLPHVLINPTLHLLLLPKFISLLPFIMATLPTPLDFDTDDYQFPLPGFRFHPTDEELVDYYLRRKVEKKSIALELIKQIDIYRHNPWDLPCKLPKFSGLCYDILRELR